ncbi:hypothetical protein [Pseudochelatococcus sp. G4_1912]|uniref:hypothetical protein n=1 Tax=Pseudochelatococcus sp. G4_1912 TaxID=3114288 RepID=UPI0039C60769
MQGNFGIASQYFSADAFSAKQFNFLLHVFSIQTPIFFVGVLTWGIQLGIAYNMLVSLVADYAHEDVCGTAIGTYYLIAAVWFSP